MYIQYININIYAYIYMHVDLCLAGSPGGVCTYVYVNVNM